MTIIIIEDEFRIRHGLVNLIKNMNPNYKIIGEAENGLEGLKMIRDLNPDLVFTDVKMPKMDGLKMIEEVKTIGLSPKFIILSGFAEFEYAQKAIRLGITDYLLKPVSVDEVMKILQKSEETKQQAENIDLDQYSPVVKDMVITMQTNYGQRLGLDIFSEKYKLTPEYICALFTKETGTTYSSYLKKVRIEEAKKFLTNTNMKIYEIACRVGYPDSKYFSKVFKEYTGISAKQYILLKDNNATH